MEHMALGCQERTRGVGVPQRAQQSAEPLSLLHHSSEEQAEEAYRTNAQVAVYESEGRSPR